MPATNRYYDALNTAARLPARVLRNFSLAVAVAGTGAILAALVPSPFDAAVAATPVLENTVTLPTVVVRPEPVTLATITVRGDDLLRGERSETESPSILARAHATGLRAVGTIAHGSATGRGLAMPYYSFAKPMRVSNEE